MTCFQREKKIQGCKIYQTLQHFQLWQHKTEFIQVHFMTLILSWCIGFCNCLSRGGHGFYPCHVPLNQKKILFCPVSFILYYSFLIIKVGYENGRIVHYKYYMQISYYNFYSIQIPYDINYNQYLTKQVLIHIQTYFKVRFTCQQSKNKKNSAKYSENMAWILLTSPI